MHYYYYWVEKHLAYAILLIAQQNTRARGETERQIEMPRDRSIKIKMNEKFFLYTNSSLHLISRNKSDLLLVKTVYLHIRWSIPLLFHFITFNIIRKLLRYICLRKVCTHVSRIHTQTHMHTFVWSNEWVSKWLIWFCMKIPHKLTNLESFHLFGLQRQLAIKPNKWCEIAFAIFAYYGTQFLKPPSEWEKRKRDRK